jgi:hypothetical protein
MPQKQLRPTRAGKAADGWVPRVAQAGWWVQVALTAAESRAAGGARKVESSCPNLWSCHCQSERAKCTVFSTVVEKKSDQHQLLMLASTVTRSASLPGNAAASAAQLVLVHGRRTGDTVSGSTCAWADRDRDLGGYALSLRLNEVFEVLRPAEAPRLDLQPCTRQLPQVRRRRARSQVGLQVEVRQQLLDAIYSGQPSARCSVTLA